MLSNSHLLCSLCARSRPAAMLPGLGIPRAALRLLEDLSKECISETGTRWDDEGRRSVLFKSLLCYGDTTVHVRMHMLPHIFTGKYKPRMYFERKRQIYLFYYKVKQIIMCPYEVRRKFRFQIIIALKIKRLISLVL